jgi:DnaK suppressor protein
MFPGPMMMSQISMGIQIGVPPEKFELYIGETVMLKRKTINQVRRALKSFPRKHSSQQSVGRTERDEYSRQELDHFKNILRGMIEDVKEDLRALSSSLSDEQNGLLISRQTDFLRSLEAALRRAEEGKYGRCTSCGKLIEKERLEAVPHTQLCVPCKQAGKTKMGVTVVPSRPLSMGGDEE